METNTRRPAIMTLLFVVLVLAMVLAVACGSGGTTSSPSPSASPKTSASASSSPAPSAGGGVDPAYQKAQEDWKQVIAAAEKEQQPATIYGIYNDQSMSAFSAEFNKINPKIQVKLITMLSAAATERLRAEQSTKQYVSNGYFGGTVRPMAKEGMGQAMDLLVLKDPGAKWVINPTMDKPMETIIHNFNKFVLNYNTQLVPPDQVPQTWTDLADPKWKGKLVLWDTHISGIAQSALGFLYLDSKHGPDVAKNILANAKLAPNSTESVKMVARGEAALTISSYGDYLTVKDAPVKLATIKDGAMGNPSYSLMTKGAPQPNTTKVFFNWLNDKPGQTVMGAWYTAIRSDVDAAAKEAQFQPGEKFLDNIPQTAEFELTKMTEVKQTIVQWTNEMGK